MVEAERQTGISNGDICNCCKHRQRTAGNYIWRYAENESVGGG